MSGDRTPQHDRDLWQLVSLLDSASAIVIVGVDDSTQSAGYANFVPFDLSAISLDEAASLLETLANELRKVSRDEERRARITPVNVYDNVVPMGNARKLS